MDRLLDPAVQEALGDITIIGFLISLLVLTVIALIRKWVVVGWTYKETEKRLRQTEERLRLMEQLAWRGTEQARQGVDMAEYLTRIEERTHDGSDE